MESVSLQSILASAFVSALISGWFLLKSKKEDYKHTYYKMILERRLQAYSKVEALITEIKVAIVDDKDNRPYHLLFSQDEKRSLAYSLIYQITSESMYFSDNLFEEILCLNKMLFRIGESDLTEHGKNHYREIAEQRTRIERIFYNDMISLHDIPSFLKNKKTKDGYVDLSNQDLQ